MRKSVGKEGGSNVKVVCRFRPLIDIELELGGEFKQMYKFPNDQSVITDQNDTFTYDKVFSMSAKQSEIFEFVGRPIIDDVLTGYNGTVLAYGQTGSGKSFSMMGLDLFNPETQGLIPRSIKQIFESLENSTNEVEYTLKCSMLEIYKEKLKDLCGFTGELKIKENKSKGIFVEGLTEIYVASEEEMLEVLASGERNRTVASTKMNNVSSRSHQLFILEVKQKLPNDSEKKGILNLVDLAGSEKINQTGVTGNKLEEAKKINLSLSALGNVIKSLTKHAEHIPYRDSKLTRLLQESLGGNYKTTLIVCCSPHPRNYEDTISTLKFAQRAKTIKNRVHLNIKKSAEEYMKIIDDLKKQLAEALNEVEFWKQKVNGEPRRFRSVTVKQHDIKGLIPEVTAEDPNEYRSDSSYTSKESETQEEIKEEIKNLRSEIEEIKARNKELTEEVGKESSKRLLTEKKYLDCFEKYNKLLMTVNETVYKQEYLAEENLSLHNQIEALKNHIKIMNNKYSEVIHKFKSGENISEWEFSDNVEDIKVFPVFSMDNPVIVNDQKPETLIGISCDPDKLIKEDCYAQEISLALEESSALNLQLVVFELKKQIINSGLVNCELFRNYSDLKLRETLMSEKFNLKLKQVKFQSSKLKLYESMLIKLEASYNKVVRALESNDSENTAKEIHKKVKIAKPIKSSGNESFEGGFRRMNTSALSVPNNSFRRQSTSVSPEKSNFRYNLLDSTHQLQTMYYQQLKQELNLVQDEKNSYKKLYAQLQIDYMQTYSKEKMRWKKFLEEFKGNCDKELIRRQSEINKLNQQIAHWMNMYIELQQVSDHSVVQKLVQKQRKSAVSQYNEKSMKMSLKDSPLHTENKLARLTLLNSNKGDESPAIFDD